MIPHERVIPIPLREDVTAYLDLPLDLTRKEAEKIAAVVLAYATPLDQGGGA